MLKPTKIMGCKRLLLKFDKTVTVNGQVDIYKKEDFILRNVFDLVVEYPCEVYFTKCVRRKLSNGMVIAMNIFPLANY